MTKIGASAANEMVQWFSFALGDVNVTQARSNEHLLLRSNDLKADRLLPAPC